MKVRMTIVGLKEAEHSELLALESALRSADAEVAYSSILHEPLHVIMGKLRREFTRRANSKHVWLEFVAEWTGYTSGQRKVVGRHYRRVPREKAGKVPSFLVYRFTDNTSNEWRVRQVGSPGKSEGSYASQIDELLPKYIS